MQLHCQIASKELRSPLIIRRAFVIRRPLLFIGIALILVRGYVDTGTSTAVRKVSGNMLQGEAKHVLVLCRMLRSVRGLMLKLRCQLPCFMHNTNPGLCLHL